MGTTKVYAPNAAYNGRVGAVVFTDGVANVDLDEHPKERAYLEAQGYGIGKRVEVDNPVLPYDKLEPTDAQGKVVDARDYAEKQHTGTPLRDAAVDPRPEDFLPPTNAGEANPHGPRVIAPEIHASGPAGIRSGEVHVGDVRRQEAEETKLASEVLAEGQLVTDRAVEFDGTPGKGNMGPLGLSDPGSVGVEPPAEVAPTADAAEVEPPAKRATIGEWRDYAVSRGATRDEADELTKAELVERYGG